MRVLISADRLHEDETTIKCLPSSLLLGSISIHMSIELLCFAAASTHC